MKTILMTIVLLALGTNASAGTAFVVNSQSGLTMIYPAADYAGDREPLPYDVAICDNDYENCLEFDFVATNPKTQADSYKSGKCEIIITRSEHPTYNEKVSITKGHKTCKVKNGPAKESINQTFTHF